MPQTEHAPVRIFFYGRVSVLLILWRLTDVRVMILCVWGMLPRRAKCHTPSGSEAHAFGAWLLRFLVFLRICNLAITGGSEAHVSVR